MLLTFHSRHLGLAVLRVRNRLSLDLPVQQPISRRTVLYALHRKRISGIYARRELGSIFYSCPIAHLRLEPTFRVT